MYKRQEEHAAAEKIAAAVAEDERLAWSLSDSNYSPVSCADATSPRTGHVPPPSPPDSPFRVARPALATKNPFDILTSQSLQVDPVLVREAARTKAAKDEATASFRLAHAATVRAEQHLEKSVATLQEGQAEERRLRKELLDLASGRKRADAEYQSAASAIQNKLVSVAAGIVKKRATVEAAAREKKVLEKESVRCRGLREAARTPAVLASDAAKAPLIPKREWKPVTRFSPAVAASPAAAASSSPAAAASASPAATASASPAATASASPAAAAVASPALPSAVAVSNAVQTEDLSLIHI